MNTILKHKLVFALLLAFVGSGLSLSQAQTQTKIVVISLGADDKPLPPFAPLAVPSPPDSDYIISATTVIDNITGLEWERLDNSIDPIWSVAWTYCADLSLDSKDDWRLPSTPELMSIVNYGSSSPAINVVAFPAAKTTLLYWSATSDANIIANAWQVFFDNGYISSNNKTNGSYVRCVRASRPIGPVLQDNNNSTVTDLATGLTWQQQEDNNPKTWLVANSYCSGLALGNISGWRLPNIKELASIVDYRVKNPAIDDAMFPSAKANLYWSTTSDADNGANAWILNFTNGVVITGVDKTANQFVRCVR